MFSEKSIQDSIFKHYAKQTGNDYELIVPNVYLYGWESDLIIYTKNGVIIEIEIKITKQDLINDKNKDKHKIIETCSDYDKPNYLIYAIPSTMIQNNVIPDQYGLIVVNTTGGVRMIRKPKILSAATKLKNKKQYLLKSTYFKYWKARTNEGIFHNNRKN